MRDYGASANELATREGKVPRTLVWVSARNRDTGAAETMGLWTGEDHQAFMVEGIEREYYGAGSVLRIEPIIFQTGLVVRMQRMTLSPLSPEVEMLIRGYEARLAPVLIHQVFFSAETMTLVGPPVRIFKGWIDEVKLTQPAIDGSATCTVTMASHSRILTRTLPVRKSDESQRERDPNDAFAQYADVSGALPLNWEP